MLLAPFEGVALACIAFVLLQVLLAVLYQPVPSVASWILFLFRHALEHPDP
jgi:hypothetical protein